MSRAYRATIKIPKKIVVEITKEIENIHQEIDLNIINILPPARMNHLLLEALSQRRWEVTDEVAKKTDAPRKYVIDVGTRTLTMDVNIRSIIRYSMRNKTLDKSGDKARTMKRLEKAGDLEGLEKLLLNGERLSAIRAEQDEQSEKLQAELSEMLVDIYRNAMIERAQGLGEIASVQENTTSEGMRMRITVRR